MSNVTLAVEMVLNNHYSVNQKCSSIAISSHLYVVIIQKLLTFQKCSKKNLKIIENTHKDHVSIYTDGSKDKQKGRSVRKLV